MVAFWVYHLEVQQRQSIRDQYLFFKILLGFVEYGITFFKAFTIFRRTLLHILALSICIDYLWFILHLFLQPSLECPVHLDLNSVILQFFPEHFNPTQQYFNKNTKDHQLHEEQLNLYLHLELDLWWVFKRLSICCRLVKGIFKLHHYNRLLHMEGTNIYP